MTRTAERTEFLSDLLVTAIEGGINYWAGIDFRDDVDPVTGTLNGKPLTCARIVDTEEQTIFTVDLDTIETGITRACTAMTNGTLRDDAQLRTANRTNGDEGDFDALSADLAVQLGLFDNVVYG